MVFIMFVVERSMARRQPRDYLVNDGLGLRRNLLRRSILNRMLDVNGVEIGAAQRSGLRARRRHKFARRYGDRRDAQTFQLDRVRSEERRVGKECRSRWSP